VDRLRFGMLVCLGWCLLSSQALAKQPTNTKQTKRAPAKKKITPTKKKITAKKTSSSSDLYGRWLAKLASKKKADKRAAFLFLRKHAPSSVPTIVAGLGHKKRAIRMGAAMILVSMKGRYLKLILRGLASKNWRCRVNVLYVLSRFPKHSAKIIPHLTRSLQDPHWWVRRNSLFVAAQWKARSLPLLPYILRRVFDKDARVREQLGKVLVLHAPYARAQVFPAFLKLLSDKTESLRELANQYLKKWDRRSPIAWMKGMLHPTSEIRSYSRKRLDALPAGQRLPYLQRALGTKYPRLRMWAMSGFARLAAHDLASLLPILRHGLQDPDPRVRRVAAAQLGGLGPAAFSALMLAYKDTSVQVRRTAVWAISRLGLQSMPVLVNALSDPNKKIRYHAAYGLAKRMELLAPFALKALFSSLDDSHKSVRKYALLALKRQTQEWMPAVFSLYAPLKTRGKLLVLSMLKKAAHPSAQKVLESALYAKHPHLQKHAARVLSTLGSKGKWATFRLKQLLESMDGDVREAALEALVNGLLTPQVSYTLLRKSLESPFPIVRAKAAQLLGRKDFHSSEALALLFTQLKSKHKAVRKQAQLSIATYGMDAMFETLRLFEQEPKRIPSLFGIWQKMETKAAMASPYLIQLLSSKKKGLRREAVKTLLAVKEFPETENWSVIRAFILEKDGALRKELLKTIGAMGKGGKQAVLWLNYYLRKGKRKLRRYMARALGKVGIGTHSIVYTLVRSLVRGRYHTRKESAVALAKLANEWPKAMYGLKLVLRSKKVGTTTHRFVIQAVSRQKKLGKKMIPLLRPFLTHKNAFLRGYAAAAIGEYEKDAVKELPKLVKMLKDPKPRVRASVARALYLIGPPPSSIPLLASCLQTKDSWEFSQVVRALGKAGKRGLPALVRRLQHAKKHWIMDELVLAIGELRGKAKETLPLLFELLERKTTGYLRMTLIQAIARVGGAAPEVIATLQPFLDDPYAGVRRQTQKSLLSLGKKGKKTLDEGLHRRREMVRKIQALYDASQKPRPTSMPTNKKPTS